MRPLYESVSTLSQSWFTIVLQNLLLAKRIAQALVCENPRTAPAVAKICGSCRRSTNSNALERSGTEEANRAAELAITSLELMEELGIVEIQRAEMAFLGAEASSAHSSIIV